MGSSRTTLAIGAIAAAALALTGCSGASSSPASTTVTFRLWDKNAAAAYETSFAEFHKQNPDISVKVDVVPWANYWTKLRTDVAGGSADDVYWINKSNYLSYARAGDLIDVGSIYGSDAASAEQSWEPAVVKQFTDGGKLWGVPQLSDGGIGVYYNKKLLADAGISPADISHLTWNPSGENDTLLKTAQKLTKDNSGKTADQAGFNPSNATQWGYSCAQDGQAIMLPFVGSAGGTMQDPQTADFTFTNPKTVTAFQYMVDLINKYHVSPSAADTNGNGNYTLDAFLQGKIGLFQSGLYNMANISKSAKFAWGTAMLPAGPAGAVSVTNGIVAVGNVKTAHQTATEKVLKWIGTKEGNAPIGATGANLPGVTAAQQSYFDYWKGQGVDVSPFFDVVKNKPTIPAYAGQNFTPASTAAKPFLDQVFLGQLPVQSGLQQAQDAGNKAMNG